MKRLIGVVFAILLYACGPSQQDKEIEALHQELIQGHDQVMPLSMQLPKLKEKVMARVEGLDETNDSLGKARILADDLTVANEGMYTWMDEFAEGMNLANKDQKVELYKRLKKEVEELDKATSSAMDAAKKFINEE